jgi:hypothetical protein
MATTTGPTVAEMASMQTLSVSQQALKELLMREVFTGGDVSNLAPQPAGAAQPGAQLPPANTPPASSPPAARDPLVFTRVQPGDLITASFVNGLIDVLHLLDLRVIALETAEAASTPAPAPQG